MENENETRPVISLPPLCKTHRSLLVHGARYTEKDPWVALEVAAQAVLFQGATCDDVVWKKLDGDVTKLPSLGCLACLSPDKFSAVVEAAKSKKLGAVADLGKRWISEASKTRKASSDES